MLNISCFSSAGRRIQIVICVCVCVCVCLHINLYIYYGFCTYYISHLGLFFVCSVYVFFSSLSLLLVLIVLGVVQRFLFPTVVLLSYTRVFFSLSFRCSNKQNPMCVCWFFFFLFFCVYYYYYHHHHSHLYKIIIPASISSVCVDVY